MQALDTHALRKRELWIAVGGEFVATTIFVFLVCGSTLNWQDTGCAVLRISLTAGLSIATLALVIGHLSGGLMNPAVNTALLVARKITVIEGALYTVAQFCGGILGAALLYGLTPSTVRGGLGVTAPAENLHGAQSFGIELLLTFVLVLSIFGATDRGKNHHGYEIPLSIGLCVFICHMVGIPFTGCSMNPARSFGPALIMNSWKHHWVYWVGPFPGAIMAALLYEHIFSTSKMAVTPA